MKRITLAVDGHINNQEAKKISSSINDLSGVVAADVAVADKKAYAYAGDRLDSSVVAGKVREAGYEAAVLQEEYLNGI